MLVLISPVTSSVQVRERPAGECKAHGEREESEGSYFPAVGTGHIKVFDKPVLLTVFFSHYSFLLQSLKMCFVYDFSHF